MSVGSQSLWTPIATVPSATAEQGSDYFSLDDIISSQQRVPCKIAEPLYRLGFLNPNNTEEHLHPGTKLELPLWLASSLSLRRKKIVAVQLPKPYRETQRTILSADANVVDLHRLGPYYYSVGIKLLQLHPEDEHELAKTLLETFMNRFQTIMDTSLNALQSNSSAHTNGMDEMERHLFSLGQLALNQLVSWERGRGQLISASLMVESRRSRKRKHSE